MTKTLLIVESPAKCKTIKKYLGSDYEVLASYGHVADLVKKNMWVDIDNNFSPTYEISDGKKKVISQLRSAAKKVDQVMIATDEDREGEAIGRHVANALKLDVATTKRITFHEITKDALTKAVNNPRTLDMDLVNAQQARRILDRLVGFELSPVLWKKIKGWLSAGRVQSVAVRLIVDREREIRDYKHKTTYKVVSDFHTAGGDSLTAELKKPPTSEKKALETLQIAKDASYTIESITTKPGTKRPWAPFTTSTLQQEASRKLGFSVSQTMQVAQKLYEWWHITYMRTDSINMSSAAKKSIETYVTKEFGDNYSNPTHYKTKKKWAQEAHECIRPTNFNNTRAGDNNQQQKLYSLIRQRAVASQMAHAKIDKTVATIVTDSLKNPFVAKGEMLTFDGRMRVYGKTTDADDHETNDKLLPPLSEWETLSLQSLNALETHSRSPARYTEASLVKTLEKEGIWRPSTYAPTIATIQKRQYVALEDRPGTPQDFAQLSRKVGQADITQSTITKNTWAEKKKLFPTDIGMVVTDFLIEHFPNIVDYGFTAQVEQDFDEVAAGTTEWTTMLSSFYKPFHSTVLEVDEHADRSTGERHIGTDPATGKPIIARVGRYGPLVQLGDSDDEDKRFASLPPHTSIETITLEQALTAFELPRNIGEYEWKPVQTNIGRFGPYVKWEKLFVSIKPSEEHPDDTVFGLQLDRAIELIKEKQEKEANRYIHQREHDGRQISVENGRYGPFIRIRAGKKRPVNIKLPPDIKKDEKKLKALTLEEVLKIAK